ncbi:heterokaryon incompatibility protein-domain-containing protein [Xylariaceae sp. FL1651]|nr:heterokaryon incompatibility protein-domain-containing protein [Xylariaceae sp. FL1651]
MASFAPLRLLSQNNGEFCVFEPPEGSSYTFDIVSYRWGAKVAPYDCKLDGVNWDVIIPEEKLKSIQQLMISQHVEYMWVDCICINQADIREKSQEVSKMYYYYKQASRCHILVDLPEMFYPQKIVDDLKFLDHILYLSGRSTMLSDTTSLSRELTDRLSGWEKEPWNFHVSEAVARSAAIDLGVLNCYSTCISQVRSLFLNDYFTRVWTFQEMLLGKNITIFGTNKTRICPIGTLDIWMDLATESRDKAENLKMWILKSRNLISTAVGSVLAAIELDILSLKVLQAQVKGISAARIDIINGGSNWWLENDKGISNIFSAISILPRECEDKMDLFKGLLGIFSGLFTPQQVETELCGDDLEKASFAFFKQLSNKTGYAYTKLAIGNRERGEWDWIPMIENKNDANPKDGNKPNDIKTDIFAGVVNLGRLKPNGRAKRDALTGIVGVPRKYMEIHLEQETMGFQFIFKGCNCGKKASMFSKELIPTYDRPKEVSEDETGKTLVQCATILGCIMDPGNNVIEYRKKMLTKLAPIWKPSDPNARLSQWIDRCVSGTIYERVDCPSYLRTHNSSMNYKFPAITGCASRLAKGSTANISCQVRVNCGCTITAPFSFIFEAITAVHGSSLGDTLADQGKDDRIILRDGLGLVQVGDIGKTFNLVAFGGDVDFHKSYASSCRKNSKTGKALEPMKPCPSGRVLVREEFSHDMTNALRDYGYVR